MKTSAAMPRRTRLQPQRGRVSGQATRCIAVLGTGNIGRKHLDILRGFEAVRPLAIPTHPERVPQVEAAGYVTATDLEHAKRLGATHCVIATDTGRHVDDGLAAIRCGFDVLIEKPIATTAREAVRLKAEAAASDRSVSVGCVLRFSESLGIFRQRLRELERLHAVRIECQSYLPDWRPARRYQDSYSARGEEGGVLRDLIHDIDYAGWLFGWPEALYARVKNLGRLAIAAEEIAELSWELSSGGIVSLCLDYLSRPSRRRITACGERGTLIWDGVAGSVTLTVDGTPADLRQSAQSRDELFAAQARAFLNAGDGTPDDRLATCEDGMRALAVCDAAREASGSRRETAITYP